MTLHDLLVELRQAPLVASVQADPGTPLDHPDALVRLAQSSIAEGVRVLRLQGIENIKAIRKATGAPVVGLLKREFTPHHVYLTSTMLDVLALISAGCEGVSLDGTRRHRPEGDSLAKMIEAIHAHGRLAVADVDTLDSAHYAKECGADMLTTALAGYTDESVMTVGPDFGVLAAAATLGLPVFAEGRYSQRWHVEAAMRIGAASVVVGGALNDPLKQTRALSPTLPPKRPVGAVDLGGTWLRFALFDPSWKLLKMDRVETPATHAVRIEWVRSRAHGLGLAAVGISSGGTIDPRTGVVVESKGTIPDHAGHGFGDLGLDIPIRALNDGLATAWGHACHPAFAARRVATLALGT
ncbi:MAG: putative N-acetylmannosamine-6-phosphate 2-epimerase, partial [Fimbriimonas ginsengisoli]|nr:putative N-acetylmannosamine-6-phosphate 2-epimerase [Fimbriimonas ginsengisoli]